MVEMTLKPNICNILKTIKSNCVKNSCKSATSDRIEKSQSMDIPSNSNNTFKSNRNFAKALEIFKMDDFALTNDGSALENNHETELS